MRVEVTVGVPSRVPPPMNRTFRSVKPVEHLVKQALGLVLAPAAAPLVDDGELEGRPAHEDQIDALLECGPHPVGHDDVAAASDEVVVAQYHPLRRHFGGVFSLYVCV